MLLVPPLLSGATAPRASAPCGAQPVAAAVYKTLTCMCLPSAFPLQVPVNGRADVCSTTALQRFDDAAAAKYPSAARYLAMVYSNPTFAAIAPAHRPAKAFSYHDSGQPWGEGPHPLSPEVQASFGPLPWSGEGTCVQCSALPRYFPCNCDSASTCALTTAACRP